MRLRHILVISCLFLLFSTAWLSAETFLKVLVVDENGNAIEKAEVSVATFKSKKGKKDKTNREGIAEFKNLKDGYYRIWARADSFKPGLYEFLRVSGEPDKQLRLELAPGYSGSDLYFESPGVLAKSKALLRQGLAAMEVQMYSEAEGAFKESLSLCPSDPAAHQNLALIYANLGKYEQAESSLNDASDLLDTLTAMGGMDSAAADTQRVELDLLRREIPVRRLTDEADQALEQENLSEAIAKLRELVKLEPDEAENYYHLANALARDGNTDEAILAVDKALEKEPDEQRYLRFKLSIAELGKKRAGERAQEIIEEIQKMQDAHDYEGAVARSQKATEELQDEYQGALLIEMARAYAGLNRPDEAISSYEKGLELEPANVEFRREMTGYLIELERYDGAFTSLQKLSEMESTAFDQALLVLAKELMQKGKQAQARVAFERVLEVNPDCAEAYYELGVEYYYGAQDKERARAMLKKYLEIGKDPELLDNAKTLLKVIK